METTALASTSPGQFTWLWFALLSVLCWGSYGVLIHTGVVAFKPGADPNARYQAFLWVGVAYFFVAVLAPAAWIMYHGNDWSFLSNRSGMFWSLLAGTAGAVGAFGVVLAMGFTMKTFGPERGPSYIPIIMSIIFAGAPIINATLAMLLHPPKWTGQSLLFFVGIGLAAAGTAMVVLFKPDH
jgi:hypothetical protein